MDKMKIRGFLDSFLHLVQKPARYFGNELNIIVKRDAVIRVAVSYPDLYEVGMSNNGIRILYDAGNSVDDAACERVFAVAPDFEHELRARDIPLYTLESYSPLYELDAVCFNMSHELLATNMLQVLDLGKIPLLRRDRSDPDPLVIAGGEAVSNPFPYADFVDLFFIGDGEEGFREILKILIRCRRDGITSREYILRKLGEMGGVLIPGDYNFSYNGLAADIGSFKKINKVTAGPDKCFSPRKPLVPSIRISQERVVVELARGCYNLCKFCHAGYYNLPYRAFNHGKVSADVLQQLAGTGYDGVTLTALSISDYRDIVMLLNNLLPELTERGISISLPSLKVDMDTLPIIETVSGLRKSSLTFAVESASDRLRSMANKKVSRRDLFSIIDFVVKKGWRRIKFYFMTGLPGCEETDEAEEIIMLLREIAGLCGRKVDINVTISPFVPKPHTPFQHEKQMSMDYFHEVIRKVKSASPRQVTVKNHDVRASFLEGLLARGDERTGPVILASYLAGARLDSWHEYFRFDIWMNSLDKCLPSWNIFLGARDDNVTYPWQVIETGSEKAVRVMRNRTTDPDTCRRCDRNFSELLDHDKYSEAMKSFERKYITSEVLGFVFSKTGNGRFIPHIDFIEIVKRGLRMAGVPVSFSRGFSKREKISSGYPVPLGIESISELVDVEIFRELEENEIQELRARMNRCLPDFIRTENVAVRQKPLGIMAGTNAVGYTARFGNSEEFSSALRFLNSREPFLKKGRKGEREYPLPEILFSYNAEGTLLRFVLYTGRESSARADEFISGITGIHDIYSSGVRIVKQCQYSFSSGIPEIIR